LFDAMQALDGRGATLIPLVVFLYAGKKEMRVRVTHGVMKSNLVLCQIDRELHQPQCEGASLGDLSGKRIVLLSSSARGITRLTSPVLSASWASMNLL
jgi:hypothetical protein